ncbi:MAG: MFS transporter [Methanomicrobiaceae archaeon]|nr:MFS transporter [Methanomicrobiaceae archaeon]
MKSKLSILLGVFTIMALSNAIVPVLPFFADEMPAIQGAIFSAYFFGAFLTVLPAGMLSDRVGKMPLIRTGLLLTLISGGIMLIFHDPVMITCARLMEGISAGLFISCAMSWVNEQQDHKKLAGYFYACLNLGLVSGLLLSGFLNISLGATGGILIFTILSAVPLIVSIYSKEFFSSTEKLGNPGIVVKDFKWLFISVIILTGATGVVTSLYPEFSDGNPLILSMQIGAMNIATIFAALFAPRFNLRPLPSIRFGAIMMAFFVISGFFVPISDTLLTIFVFAFIGAIAGFIVISQMDFLAGTGYKQGTVMGLFNAAAYGGMAFLPFFAGVISQYSGYLPAFLTISFLCLIIAFTIERCGKCRL